MIKPDFKMHTIYIIYTYLHIIARYLILMCLFKTCYDNDNEIARVDLIQESPHHIF